MTARPLRWGIVGTADIAATRMIPALRAVGHEITGVVGRTRERAAEFAAAHDIDRAGDDVAELAARRDVDAVYVCTTNALHAVHTRAALAAGVPVLCEKPLATDLTAAREMVAAADAAGLLLAVNHHLPAHTSHAALRRLVADGAVGRVLAVRVFFAFQLAPRLRGWRLTDAEAGGPILDLLPHVAAVVGKFTGAPVEVGALAVRQGDWGEATGAAEDAAVITIRHSDDALTQVHLAWATPFARNGLEIHGTTGSLVATDVMRADPGGRIERRDADGARDLPLGVEADPYERTVAAFADALAGDGRPVVDGTEGVSALAVTLAARQAVSQGVTVPLTLV